MDNITDSKDNPIDHHQQQQLYDDTTNNNTLETTNKLLNDLERKLSIISTTNSTTSSQYTNNSGSVIHNEKFNGLAKQNINSSVLRYIINNENNNEPEDDDDKHSRIYNNIFDPNELFQERHNKFMTKFGKDYNDDNILQQQQQSQQSRQRKLLRKNSLKVNQDRLEKKASDISLQDTTLQEQPQQQEEEPKESNIISQSSINAIEVDDPNHDISSSEETEELDPHHQHQPQDSEQQKYGIFYDDGFATDPETQDLSLLPPSPPRSPPRELDPDKLYGIYNFQGPDPSHCTLSKDEPVYLINDEDNYWWLIRKLSKNERINRLQKHHSTNGPEDQLDEEIEIHTDEEDGKVGFVPAECLETYGERLARLNCFKNEELERRTSGETLNNNNEEQDDENGNSVESVNSGTTQKKSNNNKSVTFEDLAEVKDEDEASVEDGDDEDTEEEKEIEDDDEEEEEEEDIRPSFGSYSKDIGPLSVQSDEADRPPSETLSDVFAETPLVIQKKKRTNQQQPTITTFSDLYVQPTKRSTSMDNISIGTYSPDTPKSNDLEEGEEENEENVARQDMVKALRRSVILDRLTQMTTDIQEQMKEGGVGDGNSSDDDDQEEGDRRDIDELPSPTITNSVANSPEQYLKPIEIHGIDDILSSSSSNPVVKSDHQQYLDDEMSKQQQEQHLTTNPQGQPQTQQSSADSIGFQDSSSVSHLSLHKLKKNSIDDECIGYFENEEEEEEDTITPLTSMNSLIDLNNKEQRRKSKPVHEMFIPILGKFDELVEKLAELDEMLK
ncbi:BUD14 [[Candida] subhashii]|uniref:BUD14 n=1 Tax=[Candida] subhashii TaxID=561895 RepID=A0A8J5V1P0_9ASCO|nr:BUD14 [[Candida] subhashii]KAG7665945.1 BUD14 [[Candida] subhashii]